MRSKTHKNDTPKLFMKNIFSLREKDTVRGKNRMVLLQQGRRNKYPGEIFQYLELISCVKSFTA